MKRKKPLWQSTRNWKNYEHIVNPLEATPSTVWVPSKVLKNQREWVLTNMMMAVPRSYLKALERDITSSTKGESNIPKASSNQGEFHDGGEYQKEKQNIFSQ